MQTPEFIYFDLGKVLLEFSHDRMCSQMGELVDLDAAATRAIVFDSGLSHGYETGEIDDAEFCELFFEKVGKKCDPADLLRAAGDIFSVKREMTPLLAALATCGIPLGILSNTCPVHWNTVTDGRFASLPAMFQKIVVSYEVGAMKPLAKIYEVAAETAGVEPARIFFVDDREDNIEGARAAGFDAHLFESSLQVQKLLMERGVRFNY